ncbi:MAG: 23S rRNA (pseudouridine(1915)-N(3))-methyltransferase RlmH [Deltaproteobacteria bacterium]|jgi:23S rRNA (pseudouridine1915-N3)-methyltransferase|nr:23S rRNA (pseudouridine(1915)-N(3))-methyltransferase RlmH [Deltaproteobacteria bacterium]
MKLRLYTVGKNKTDEYSALCGEFEQRIHRKIPFIYRNFSDQKALLNDLKDQWFVVLMNAGAKMPKSSVKFAHLLKYYLNKRQEDVVFIIGGAYGFENELLARGDRKISLSPLTFPHRMARLILVEQIYRALSILDGEPYSH